MRAFTSDTFVLPLPERHRFPMAKYRRLRERVEAELPVRLLPAQPVDRDQLALVHEEAFLDRVFAGTMSDKEVRVLGFPQIPELVWREQHSSGGTLCAARAALEDGASANLAGGTHHAGPARAQGYCLFNDAAVTLKVLRREGRIRRGLVVDLDVHQGNGTAECLADDASLFTFSVHGAKNFPFVKAASDLDVPLPDGVADEAYLEAVQDGLFTAIDAARPDLVVFNAGVDVFEADRLGRMAVSAAGVGQRDAWVFSTCRERGIPVAVTMGGGYADDVERIVDLHLNTIRTAARSASGRSVTPHADAADRH